jgi:hypothetical protein
MRSYEECRCYVDHLIAEHRRLHQMLRLARATIVCCSGPDRAVTGADVVRVLRQVRKELEHHFAEEEGDGCLDEAVSNSPSLSAEARRIEAEHPQLLANMDRLIAEAQDCDESVKKRIAVRREFDELCRQLNAHEAAENALLRKGFGTNVNGEENTQSTLTHDVQSAV